MNQPSQTQQWHTPDRPYGATQILLGSRGSERTPPARACRNLIAPAGVRRSEDSSTMIIRPLRGLRPPLDADDADDGPSPLMAARAWLAPLFLAVARGVTPAPQQQNAAPTDEVGASIQAPLGRSGSTGWLGRQVGPPWGRGDFPRARRYQSARVSIHARTTRRCAKSVLEIGVLARAIRRVKR